VVLHSANGEFLHDLTYVSTQYATVLASSVACSSVVVRVRDVATAADQMHNVNGYVRDFYFFRRNFYPQLSLVHMNTADATTALHSQVTSDTRLSADYIV